MRSTSIIWLPLFLLIFLQNALYSQFNLTIDNNPMRYYNSEGAITTHHVKRIIKTGATYKLSGEDSTLQNRWTIDTMDYDRSGKLIARRTSVKADYIYNKEGWLIEIKTNYLSHYFNYDSIGNMRVQRIVYPDGRMYQCKIHSYDSNQRLIQSKEIVLEASHVQQNVVDSVLDKSYHYHYDDRGRIVQQELKFRDNRNIYTDRTILYTYTDSVIIVERIPIEGDRAITTFDTAGNLTTYYFFDSLLNQTDSIFYYYSTDGVLRYKRQHMITLGAAGTGHVYTTYAYGKDGMLRRERSVYRTDQTNSINVFEYNYSFHK